MIADILFVILWITMTKLTFIYIIDNYPFYIRIGSSLFFGLIISVLVTAGIIALKDLSWIDWKLLGKATIGISIYIMIMYLINKKFGGRRRRK